MQSFSTRTFIAIFLISFIFGSLFAQTNWVKSVSGPVMAPGSTGSWDDGAVTHPAVIYDGSLYHMWYGGWRSGLNISIGYATSTDGVSWTKYNDPATAAPLFAESDPVLTAGPAGSWDGHSVHTPTVIFDGVTFHMWFQGRDNQPNANGTAHFGYASSPDGITWSKYNNAATTAPLFAESDPVLSPGATGAWDDFWLLSPMVIINGNTFEMWYGGIHSNINGDWQIGRAISTDGISWTKSPGTTVLIPDEPWANKNVATPAVLLIDNVYHMWYGGSKVDVSGWDTGYAYSSDGIIWDKDPVNPCMPRGTSGKWDELQAWGATVIFDTNEGHFKAWYHGSKIGGKYHIGYAETLPVAVAPLTSPLTTDFSLAQNYPNPFNPSTNIEFTIPEAAFVSLSVYNTLGEKVAALATEYLPAGSYQYIWQAGDLPAGIYFYRLQAGAFNQVKKAVLLR